MKTHCNSTDGYALPKEKQICFAHHFGLLTETRKK